MFRPASLLLLIVVSVARTVFAQSAAPDFSHEVRPILADNCFNCHGPDERSRKSGLRLDERDAALKGGKSGLPGIVPGRPNESEILAMIDEADPESRMPPADSNKTLSPAQKDILRRWVQHGAEYKQHWAFIAPVRPSSPAVRASSWPRNDLDRFVLSRIEREQLTPAPPAEAATLCRRLHLDLTGLPPTLPELDAFAAAHALSADSAVQALVDRLLASPHYGEKWGRHWLDAARYADSDGYEKDLPREQWAWRDWVITALNDDKPYDQFVIEQIAGDLLAGPRHSLRERQDLIIATGFVRNSMVSEEGAIVAEQYRMEGMFDRMDCLGKAVLGVTLQCAQCHTHKFDPIKHDDYYRLFAYLNNTYEAISRIYSPEKLSAIERILREQTEHETQLKSEQPDWAARIAAWAESQQDTTTQWEIITPIDPVWTSGVVHPLALPDHSILSLGARANNGDLSFIAEPKLAGITGLRLEALTHGDLIFGGPGRSFAGLFAVTELTVEVQSPGEKNWTKLALLNVSADFESPERPIAAPFRLGDDDKRRLGPSAFLIDGSNDTAWSPDRGPGRRNAATEVVVQFKEPLDASDGVKLRVRLQFKHSGKDTHGRASNLLGRFRVALTCANTPVASSLSTEARLALAVPADRRTPAQQAAIFSAWRSGEPEFAAVNAQIEKLWATHPEADTTVLHLAERPPEDARATFVLDRGAWDQPRRPVEPGTPAFLHTMTPSDEPARLAFARWLVDHRSPTTARVAVNRVWQAIFGGGLVETSEDFGMRAGEPAQPEVLDWLAIELMERGWSQKQLIRTIVTSATYRQSSDATPELIERDPRNRLLARGPRFRVEAEIVRDLALHTAGLLHETVGGPSIFPPMPESVFASSFIPVTFWKTATGPERYRRSLYVFRRRSMPDPLLASFDAPNGDAACARRERSNTPLAALASLNETIFVEAARALALRVLREGGATDASRATFAFRLCTARVPRPSEVQEILTLVASRRARLTEGWISASDIATGDPAKLPGLPPRTTPADAAVWTIAARVLLNLDETLTKN